MTLRAGLHACRVTLLLVALLRPSVSRAQSLTGTVLLPDSTPAAGAVVQVTNSASGAILRALASSTGSYSVRLAGAGRYEVRVLRIGFEPTILPLLDLQSGESRTVRVVLHGARLVLPTVNVAENRSCRVNPDTALGVARAWTEARSALIATQLSSGGRPLVADRVEYDRTMDVSGSIVRSQRVKSSRIPVTTVWESPPPDTLALHGYAVDNADGTMFYAPDAAVLLSDSFAATHCFRLVAAPADDADLLGVQFEPSRSRSGVRDISGAFWLSRATAELRSVDFHYTNLSAEIAAAGAGGTVEFLRLPTGEWVVSRWSLHTPRLAAPQSSMANGVPLKYSASRLVPDGMNVAGGEVLRVVRGDSLLYEASGHALNIQFTSTDSATSTAHAHVRLVGTEYSATADASGRVSLKPVVEGKFAVQFATALMDSLGAPPSEREVTVGDATHVDTIALPSSRDMVRRVCAADSLKRGPIMLRGSARTARGFPIPNADVTVTWRGAVSRAGNQLAQDEYTAGVLTDASGGWRLCGVPADRPLVVRIDSDSGSAIHEVRISPQEFLAAADLTVSSALRGSLAPRTHALVEFLAIGPGGARLSNVTLDVTTGGVARTVMTNEAGRALVPDLTPGVIRVRARRIGFKAGEISAQIASGRNTVPIILGTTALPGLDTIRVVGDQMRSTKNDEFDTRHLRHEATASFGEDEIMKRAEGELWHLFESAPSVSVEHAAGNRGALYPISKRGPALKFTPKGLDSRPCYMAVMIDGVVVRNTYSDSTNAFDLRDLPPPEAVHGVEIFGGAASIPMKYAGVAVSDQTCGLIAVWTRR